jgi:hypothetical protein
MRHVVENKNVVCPLTGRKFKHAWSNNGLFDSCEQCCPKGFVPVGERLRQLESQRRADEEREG